MGVLLDTYDARLLINSSQDGLVEIKQKYFEIFCISQSERKSYALSSQHQLPESILTVMEAVSPEYKTQPILYFSNHNSTTLIL